MHPLKDKACIVGVGETAYTRGTNRSELSQILHATAAAAEDAGLSVHDIDGIVTPMPMPTVEHLAANLGIEDLRYSAASNIGGAAPVAAVQTAAMAVALGVARHVLIPVGWNAYSGAGVRGAKRSGPVGLPPSFGLTMSEYYMPFGLAVPVQWLSWLATRYVQQYMVPIEGPAAVAMAARKHAQLNQNAFMRNRPMTMEDYRSARIITEPFRLVRLLPGDRRRLRGDHQFGRARSRPEEDPGLYLRDCGRPSDARRRYSFAPGIPQDRTAFRHSAGAEDGGDRLRGSRTSPRSTIASLISCCSNWRRWAFANRARRGSLSRTAESNWAASCRSTLMAVCSPKRMWRG